MKERENLHQKNWQCRRNNFKTTVPLRQLQMWLVDLDYSFECDWPTELSDNKLSTNNMASE